MGLWACVHTQFSTFGVYYWLWCQSLPAQTTYSDCCWETCDGFRWPGERSMGQEWLFFHCGFWTTGPRLQKEEKVISYLAVLRPPCWHLTLEGRTEQEGHFHHDVFSLPRFRMFFQPGSCPPCVRALVSILGNSPIVKLASRKFCFLPRTWKNKPNHCQVKKWKIPRLCILRVEIKLKNLEQNPPELPLSSISSKSKLCFYIYIYVVIIRDWYIYQF